VKPFTWEQAGQACFDEVPRMARKLPLRYWADCFSWQDRVAWLFREHERTKTQVDAAAAQFSQTMRWPDTPPGTLNYLGHLRLMCAVDTVNILLAGEAKYRMIPDPGIERDSTTVLNWLLIETWHSWRWDGWLKLAVIRGLGGPNSFYAPPVKFPDN
jgi:hypothetical protein